MKKQATVQNNVMMAFNNLFSQLFQNTSYDTVASHKMAGIISFPLLRFV
jgi:hypothetical protein